MKLKKLEPEFYPVNITFNQEEVEHLEEALDIVKQLEDNPEIEFYDFCSESLIYDLVENTRYFLTCLLENFENCDIKPRLYSE